MTPQETNLDIALRYIKSIESGEVSERMSEFLHSDVIVELFPHRYLENGSRSDLATCREASERGKKVMTRQSYEIRNAMTDGDKVALEIYWTGTLAIPFASIPAGGEMRAHFAAFFDFKDGKIFRQRNYDCYLPWCK